MDFASELKERGLVSHVSADVSKILGKTRAVYFGVDPTADSLHVGHLVPVLLMKRLADAGHKVIFLVGGGTGTIGDPKEKGERPLLEISIINKNVRTLEKQIRQVIGKWVLVVNNADWLGKVRLVDFLRDVGKHFTVNELIKRDLVRKRLETPDESISYSEFSYALLQAYDFLVLNEKHGCDLQVGADDQWTNILSGVELIRKRTGKEVYALTVPLVTDDNGKKFGKSEGNAVWLDPEKTSPFKFYQFWMNLPDKHVEAYLKIYTFLGLGEIKALMELHRRNPGAREAQKTLARLITETVHGKAAAINTEATSEALFGTKPFSGLSSKEQKVALTEAPSLTIFHDDLEKGYGLADALSLGKLVSSKSEARRIITAKGVSVNGLPAENPDQKLSEKDFLGGYALIRKGKRDVLILRVK